MIWSGEQQDPGEWDGHLRGGGGGEGWCGDQVSLGVNSVKCGLKIKSKSEKIGWKSEESEWSYVLFVSRTKLYKNTKHNLNFQFFILSLALSVIQRHQPALTYLEIKLDIQLQ